MYKGSRNRVLLIVIGVLLLTNLAMVFLFFRMNKPAEEKRGPGFTERLKKDVGFTPEQMAVYEPKKKAFWDGIRKRFEEIRTTKKELYHFMYDPTVPDSVMNSKAEIIGEQQKDLDLFVVKHFKDVRTLCKPDQLNKYDSLLPVIIERMTTRPKRK